jgi:hypothetical protein
MLKETLLTVDFAGTREEARQFTKEHPELQLAHKDGPAGGGLPMLHMRVYSNAKRAAAIRLLASLGWDEHSFIESTHVYRDKPATIAY